MQIDSPVIGLIVFRPSGVVLQEHLPKDLPSVQSRMAGLERRGEQVSNCVDVTGKTRV
jgi:hypothetical protein